MIKAVLFDVDGVLVCPSNHYLYLKKALNTFGHDIEKDDFYTMDAMPSLTKLEWLTKHKGLPVELYKQIIDEKYKLQLKTGIECNPNLKHIFKDLKERGIKIALVSNAKSIFIKNVIEKAELTEYVDMFVSVDEAGVAKPSPSMYLHAMSSLNVSPFETLIVEDSKVGREAAFKSGAKVHGVSNWLTLDTDFPDILEAINTDYKVPYISSNLNVLIPMAGKGSRFSDVGYTTPKPLVPIRGLPMIQRVVENLNCKANYIFLVLEEHLETYDIDKILRNLSPNCHIVTVPSVTEGAASTAMYAKDLINNDNPLLICNSDQIIEWDSRDLLHKCESSDDDGFIFCFKDNHPKWSFAKLDDNNNVCRVAEKNPISDNATTGHYYWKKGSDFVKYTKQMISKNIRVNNEFYIAPVFNEAIRDNKIIKAEFVSKMWGVGTPEDLDFFLREYKGTL